MTEPVRKTCMQIEYNDNWIANNPELFAKSFLEFKQNVMDAGLLLKYISEFPGKGFTTISAFKPGED